MKCLMCEYFSREGFTERELNFNPILGECRRYPPTGVGNGTGFPHVEENDWCGESKLKEAIPIEPPVRLVRDE